jgi:hypothetical protein
LKESTHDPFFAPEAMGETPRWELIEQLKDSPVQVSKPFQANEAIREIRSEGVRSADLLPDLV